MILSYKIGHELTCRNDHNVGKTNLANVRRRRSEGEQVALGDAAATHV